MCCYHCNKSAARVNIERTRVVDDPVAFVARYRHVAGRVGGDEHTQDSQRGSNLTVAPSFYADKGKNHSLYNPVPPPVDSIRLF